MSASEAPQLDVLLRVIRSMAAARDVPCLAVALERAVRELTGAEDATLVVRGSDSANGAAEASTAADVSTQRTPFATFATDLSGMVFERGEAVVIEDSTHAEQIGLGSSGPIPSGSVAAVPVGREAVIGAVVVSWSTPFAAGAHLELLRALADAAAVTLENIQLLEVKEAQLALNVSEQWLRTIVDSTPALVYVVDVDHNFVLINREFGRLFNLDVRGIRGRSIYDCFPRETADQFAIHNRQVIDGGAPSEFEEVVQQQDGLHYYVSVKAPLFDEANRPVSICGVSTDITQQKRLVSALELASREKDAFVATVAHELRQPLGAIQAALGVMRTRPDPAQGERAHQIIERQVAQLTRLVEDLVDAARVAQGKITLRLERLTLNSVLDGALAVVGPAVQHAGQHLDLSLPSDPVWVHADATRLQQVFSNLLTNASKFTEAGGRIALSVALTPESAVVRVSDNGRGIAPDVLPHIFDLFAQASPDGCGLGIGLSVVRELVLQHGGAVEVHSDGIGEGSEFTVRLPRAD